MHSQSEICQSCLTEIIDIFVIHRTPAVDWSSEAEFDLYFRWADTRIVSWRLLCYNCPSVIDANQIICKYIKLVHWGREQIRQRYSKHESLRKLPLSCQSKMALQEHESLGRFSSILKGDNFVTSFLHFLLNFTCIKVYRFLFKTVHGNCECVVRPVSICLTLHTVFVYAFV